MGVRKRRARRNSRTHIVGFGIAGIFGFVAMLMAALAVSLGALVSSWLQDLPDYNSADAYLVSEPTQIVDANGTVIAEYYLQNRRSIEIADVSDYVLKGIIDIEDLRFYRHHGVDPQGIARAVVAQLMGSSEGASTITQQLVRNTILSDEQFDYTIKRKVREAYLAVQMEKMYTKDQILMMYLNTIYFGHQAYGIQAAAITYFNKDASELTLAEAATLCGLPQSPSNYDPLQNPELALKRRNIVLDRMLSAGDINQEQHDEAVNAPIETHEGSFLQNESQQPYFTDYVKQLLLEDFDQDTVFQGGLKVYTTIDPSYQDAAERAVATRLSEIGNVRLDAALVAVDPDTGYIKAMVGGRDYAESQFNLATQARRQPGSSFKVFTLVAALREGMSPNTYINCNSPMTFSPTWTVQNFGNESYGPLSMAQAFAVSSNTGFVQIAEAIGADKIVSAAHDMGISVDLPAYSSLTLGTVGVPPVQMAEAYATIATGGVHRNAIAITRIEDRNGNTVYEHEDKPTRAIEEDIASAALEVMKGVTSGGGTAAVVGSGMTANQPVAGKTGTTENFRDLWFCGITPQLSVAIWCGYREEAEVYVWGSSGHPYNTACPIFTYFVNSVLEGVERKEFPTPGIQPTYKDNSSWSFPGGTYNWSDVYYNYDDANQGEADSQSSDSYGGGDSQGGGGGGQQPPADDGGTGGAPADSGEGEGGADPSPDEG
ncbi:MAG: PBP1A family penicillin-binding protein [Acidobacteriota bacterium]|nr:PBP1A family penicillin-binding protein [Acidobacteriota bacterium]